ncbi:MAG: FlgD immunoglobulin-like domain containing protein [Candidatus Zixiibacteriota bacterium]
MRCRQVRQRLTECRGNLSQLDNSIREHLMHCHACAEAARVELQMARDFQRLSGDDAEGGLPLQELRTRVDAVSRPDRELIMSKITGHIKRRPRLVAVSAVIAFLLLTTLIPIRMHKTVGYEVAFAGVQKDLAMDEFKIQELLTTIGVEKAGFEVGACEQTCELKILDLRSEQDLQIVLTAFNELGNVELQNVQEIEGDESSSIVAHIKNVFFDKSGNHLEDKGALCELVINRMDSLHATHNGNFSIFYCGEDSENVAQMKGHIYIGTTVDCNTDNAMFNCSTLCLGPASDGAMQMILHDSKGMDLLHEIHTGAKIYSGCDPSSDAWSCYNQGAQCIKAMHCNIETIDGVQYWTGTDKDGNPYKISMQAPDFAEQLRAKGDPNIIVDEIGGPTETIDGAEKPDAALPDGFELSQNYPNPFNPMTTINYTLPQSDHVRLDVINVQGQIVRTLVDQVMGPGEHSVVWDSKDAAGAQVSSGIYVYRLTAGDASTAKKMTLLK